MPRRRLRVLRIGSHSLGLIMGPGPHRYDVIRDPVPIDARIVAARMAPDGFSAELVLEHESFDLVDPTVPAPAMAPVFSELPR
jgi:hypothetical protein